MIRNAEYWAISALKRAELWTAVRQNILGGEVYEDLFNATTYYAAAECIQRVFSSAGERSQTNFPESFPSRQAGGIGATQPDWRTNYANKMKLAETHLASFLQFMKDEEESSDSEAMAQVSNRDFDSNYDEAYGLKGSNIDFM
jgi:hypothetical protein